MYSDAQLEEWTNWKVNTSLLYDFVLRYTPETPSISCAFAKGLREVDDTFVGQKVVTATSFEPVEKEKNYLLVSEVYLPRHMPVTADKDRTFKHLSGDLQGFTVENEPPQVTELQRIAHPWGEVNSVRLSPHKSSLAACSAPDGKVRVFDLPVLRTDASDSAEFVELAAHIEEAWSLDWNKYVEAQLLSCGKDFQVCLWDVESPSKPFTALAQFSEWPNEAVWITASQVVVGDEAGALSLFDLRRSTGAAAVFRPEIGALNCVASHPTRPHLVAAGGSKHMVIWDVRKQDYPVHSLWGHDLTSQLMRVQFHPTHEQYLVSANTDGQVTMWDLSAIGKEQLPDDELDGPSELMFTHSGHLSSVYDLCWNPEPAFDMMLLTTSADSSVQAWQVPATTFGEESDLEIEDSNFAVE
ncbi:MAG: hypothetical protein KVP17_000902 [Porospora cf. gigantea B]|uniref:uncharacterized protein n=1 Tax=Porospora cf. gigantea B TaxID=2853592 RepID=UPI003571FBDC|nr:MAG: hypothetical protein KVP17_000902 [Porospora cf. gigantea B]